MCVCVCTSRKYVSGVEEKNGFFQLEDLALNRRLIYIMSVLVSSITIRVKERAKRGSLRPRRFQGSRQLEIRR